MVIDQVAKNVLELKHFSIRSALISVFNRVPRFEISHEMMNF